MFGGILLYVQLTAIHFIFTVIVKVNRRHFMLASTSDIREIM